VSGLKYCTGERSDDIKLTLGHARCPQIERMRVLQSGLDRELADFKRTASQATSFSEKAAGLLAAQFADVPSEQLSAQVGKVFAKVDLDGNGVLDREEMKVAFAGLLGRRLTDDEISLMLLDVFKKEDGHEEVDPVEFEHSVRYYLFVPCTDKCYVCDPAKRGAALSQSWPSEALADPASQTRPQRVRQQQCRNFASCGFQGTVRAVATHELTCSASCEAPALAQGHCISAAHTLRPYNGCACFRFKRRGGSARWLLCLPLLHWG
jgi:hypothetical protein